jgi:hypothetical protein
MRDSAAGSLTAPPSIRDQGKRVMKQGSVLHNRYRRRLVSSYDTRPPRNFWDLSVEPRMGGAFAIDWRVAHGDADIHTKAL